jgi:hypothetical protein
MYFGLYEDISFQNAHACNVHFLKKHCLKAMSINLSHMNGMKIIGVASLL